MTGFRNVAAVDLNENGLFDRLIVEIGFETDSPGSYTCTAVLKSKNNTVVVDATSSGELTKGASLLTFQFTGQTIGSSALDGPYLFSDLNVYRDKHWWTSLSAPGMIFQTTAYAASQFEGYVSTSPAKPTTPTTPTNATNATNATIAPTTTIRFTGRGNWTGVHLNRNGLIDRLDVELDVETNASGSYSFSAALKNKDNTEVGYYNSSAVLTKGVNNLTFQFSGQRIGSSGIQGPFYLRDLHVWGDSSLPSLLLPDPAFDMIPLNASQFEGYIPFVPAIRLVTEGGNSTGNSTGVDSNQNRFYDRLDVEIKIETNVPGVYSWFATLNDKNSTEVGFCVRSAAFTIGINLLKCTFNGRPIGANGVDGPFFVSNLFVWGVGQTPLVLDGPVFKTIALKASQFEGYTPTTSVPSIIPAIQLTGKTSSTGVHLNQDGFYDRLDVEIEIKTFTSGSYSWLATLNDNTYTEIGFFMNSAVFTAGINRLTFEFRGRPIGVNGVDGPFFISNLFVWGDNQPSLVRSGPVIETIALKANQFAGYVPTSTPVTTAVPPNVIIPASRLTGFGSTTGVDFNSNSLFDRLDVEIEIQTYSSGSYSWLATLIDKNSTVLGFYVSTSFFTAGINRLSFQFSGQTIGSNGVNGPFVVSNLIVWLDGQPSLVVSGRAYETIALSASKFEGYVPIPPAVFTKAPPIPMDNKPPVALCANVDVVADASTCSVASASINNGSTDPDLGDKITTVQTPAGPYTLGITPVVLTVTDTAGLTANCSGTVTVVDATPPIVTCYSNRNNAASRHYDVNYTVTDACDRSPTVTSKIVACHGQYQLVSIGQTLGISFDCNDTSSGQAVVPDSIVVTATDKAGKVGSCSKVLQDSTTPNTPNPTTKKPSSPGTKPPITIPKVIPKPSTKPMMMMMMNMMAYRRPYAVPRGKHGLRGGNLDIFFRETASQPQGHEHGTTRGMM